MARLSSPPPIKRFAFLLILVVLLPALFYSVYEINSLTTSEELMESIYRQQLEVVLFSLNQDAWDVASSWRSSITVLAEGAERKGAGALRTAVRGFLSRNPGVETVFFADTLLREVTAIESTEEPPGDLSSAARLRIALQAERAKAERLTRLRRSGYGKVEPILLPSDSETERKVALVFARSDPYGGESFSGFVIDERSFIVDILGPRIREAAGEEFVLAVVGDNATEPLLSTSEIGSDPLPQQSRLWLFPGYSLGVRLRGTTIDELLKSRFTRNLTLILALDLLLVVAAWFLYRTLRRETDLVRMKSDFVSTVSHELRTPLSLIRMYAETLEMGRVTDEEKRKRYETTIVKETDRLSRLVNNILNFSRIEAGRKQYHFGPVDLNGVVRGVMDTFTEHVRELGFDPVVSLQEGLPLIRADGEAVSEAVINILDNAVKYSRQEKYLRVVTGMSDAMVFLEVEDHGIGIAREDQKKIFETFYRVSTGLVHDTKGSGLGLALVRHIVDAHGGKVEVRSEHQKGSLFRISFRIETTT
jgi:two-component system phosphate regulon sensor histidine kinase PhoR